MEQETIKKTRTSKVKQLENQIQKKKKSQNEMFEQFSSMMEMMKNMMSVNQKSTENFSGNDIAFDAESSIEEEIPEQPKADSMIRVVSLCQGELNLKNGRNGILKFTHYGEIKPIMYSQLIDIVNLNKGFASAGDFYIENKSAVYHLGLQEEYKHIYPLKVLNNIENYDNDEIEEIIHNMCKSQRETVVTNIVNKLYKDENINQNKVKLISKLCNVDIHAMVRTMHEVDENMKERN